MGIAWTEDGTPLALAVLSRMPDRDAVQDDTLIERTATALADALGGL
ncbi:hypothetical protein [Streptomyces caelestis]